MYAVFDRQSARPPPCIATCKTPWTDPGTVDNPGIGYESASSHLRAIRLAKYGANSCEAKAPSGLSSESHSGDLAEFYCGAILSDNTTGAFRGGGAVAYSRSDPNVSLAYAVQQWSPVNELPVVVVCYGSVENTEEICQLYGLDPKSEYSPAELIRELYCRDFADADRDGSDQPATCLQAITGDWCFVLFDAATQYLLAAQSAAPRAPLYWGCAADDGAVMFSTDPAVLPSLCGDVTEFPHSCFFENDGFQNPSYEYGNIFSFTRRSTLSSGTLKRTLQPIVRVDSADQICGINFRTMSGVDLCTMDTARCAV